MKCLILAGGSGDRLWPLSRRDYPKQFLNFEGNRSLFQEALARNLPFCEEFLILTNGIYESIIKGQLMQFQGLSRRFMFEEEGRGTAASLFIASQLLDPEETILVVPADLIVGNGGYSQSVYKAKELTEFC